MSECPKTTILSRQRQIAVEKAKELQLSLALGKTPTKKAKRELQKVLQEIQKAINS